MAFEAILKAEFLVHPDHPGILAVAHVAGRCILPGWGEPRSDHQEYKDQRFLHAYTL
jgi:hypothetical protein